MDFARAAFDVQREVYKRKAELIHSVNSRVSGVVRWLGQLVALRERKTPFPAMASTFYPPLESERTAEKPQAK